ncbi:hypothetical protein [Streptomyces sp. CBMA29]|uniref:hypothetical protein n=1 Tax=Streptomyces sp. CBMA29 TaxID=1896314 RepID=UPI0039808915|nr:hypothetical protein [Streptomyces sp. CBMA29]
MRTGGKSYYYLTDADDSVLGLVNNTGSRVYTYAYTPAGVADTTTETVPQPYRFQGTYLDPTGLYKMGARPINHTDPDGTLLESTSTSIWTSTVSAPPRDWALCGVDCERSGKRRFFARRLRLPGLRHCGHNQWSERMLVKVGPTLAVVGLLLMATAEIVAGVNGLFWLVAAMCVGMVTLTASMIAGHRKNPGS